MGTADEQLFQRFGREFPAGTVLFREGEPGAEMYVIHAGVVQISKRVRDAEKVLSRLGPGEFFGEMALLNHRPRNATAVAIEDAKLLVIEPRTFEAMIRGNSEIAVRFIRRLAERLEDSNEQIESLMLRDPASRVAHVLWRGAERHGNGVLLPVPTSDLPARLGLRSQVVDEVLGRLVRARLVELEEGRARVPDAGRLRQYLDYLELKERFSDV